MRAEQTEGLWLGYGGGEIDELPKAMLGNFFGDEVPLHFPFHWV